MNKVLIGAALVTFVAVLGSCGKKDDAILLLPDMGGASASSAPGVPAEDLQPTTTGTASGGGSVTVVTGGSANPSNSGSTGGTTGGTSGSGESGSGSGTTGGTSGSGESGSGSTGGTSGSGESGSGSTGGTSDGKSKDGKSKDGKSSDGKTLLEYTGSQYSHIEGTWYQDGTVMFTYGTSPIGYSVEGLRSGLYRVTVTAMNWGSNGEEWALPVGFSQYNIAAAADGSSVTINVLASSSGFKSGSADLNISSGTGNLLLAFLNPSCGDASASSGKTAICHIPPGNPANKHTIVVGDSAVKAHQKAHGDTVGGCAPACANLAIGTVRIERIGAATVTGGYLSGAKGKRNIAIALITVIFAAGALFAINLMAKRKAQQ